MLHFRLRFKLFKQCSPYVKLCLIFNLFPFKRRKKNYDTTAILKRDIIALRPVRYRIYTILDMTGLLTDFGRYNRTTLSSTERGRSQAGSGPQARPDASLLPGYEWQPTRANHRPRD